MPNFSNSTRRVRQDSWIAFLTSLTLHTSLCVFFAFAVTMGSGGRAGSGKRMQIDGTIGNSIANGDMTTGADLHTLETTPEDLGELIALEFDSLNRAEDFDVQFATADISVDTASNAMASETDRILSSGVQTAGQGSGAVANRRSQRLDGSGQNGGATKHGNGYAGDSDKDAGKGTGNEGPGTSASFFGAKAQGKKFVFVIDSSTSMRGERWRALCDELERAIQALGTDQKFFILGFDSEPHPMFGKFPPQGKYLNSNPATLKRVKNWLRSIELGRRTYPARAIMIGLQLAPDAIFLLSDGELMDNTVKELRKYNFVEDGSSYSWSVPIHTILLHSQMGYSTLETIAVENNGTFTPVDIETD